MCDVADENTKPKAIPTYMDAFTPCIACVVLYANHPCSRYHSRPVVLGLYSSFVLGLLCKVVTITTRVCFATLSSYTIIASMLLQFSVKEYYKKYCANTYVQCTIVCVHTKAIVLTFPLLFVYVQCIVFVVVVNRSCV